MSTPPETAPRPQADAPLALMDRWPVPPEPRDLQEARLAHEVAALLLDLDRLHHKEAALRRAAAEQARTSWDADRRGAALAFAAGLSRHPALALARLRRTKHGCELVADRWDTLHATLARRGRWTNPERRLALNLLDVPPELREAPSQLDAPEGADPLEHLKAVAQAEARRHRALAAQLAPVDAIQRDAAILGLGPDDPETLAVHRAQREIARQLARARSQLKPQRPIHPGPAGANRTAGTPNPNPNPNKPQPARVAEPAPNRDPGPNARVAREFPGPNPAPPRNPPIPGPAHPRPGPDPRRRRRRRRA